MSKTEKNLMDAFAGESQANRKYLAFAKQADKEGLPQVAKLFRAAAEAETIHAHAHLRNAGKIGDTTANLKATIEGETYEFTKMYPEMIADAKEEGGQHQLIFQVIHAEKASFHIPHAYGVEELGDSKHGERIGLTAGQKSGILKKGT